MSFRLAAASLRNISRATARRTAVQFTQRATGLTSSRFISTSRVLNNNFTEQVTDSLKSELEHENANKEDFPEDLSSFLATSGYEVVPTEGQALGKVIKKTPTETVHVFFDVNQVVNIRPAEVEGAEEEENFDEGFDNSFINLNVVIEKKSDGSAVSFDVLVGPEDGSTYIENVTAHEVAADALTESAEADQKRETSYNGPAFSNLDEALQISLENYLSSRGVNNELYQFILNFGIYKENVEYVQWLENLHKYFK